ncbi:MAG TPA: hypothetical protein VFH99_03635 [Candidatus Saccharimonadales bacterium]|nr:hypothetical protein [Candidatus Saccharimonadales bacterium]
MRDTAETVYAAEWPGFPGETTARHQARGDLRTVDESFNKFLPADALVRNEALKAEQTTAFKETDESPIYDYEIEIQRPVPALEEVYERVSWRQRAKQAMGKAGDALKEVSVSAIAMAQAKAEGFYGDEEKGSKRKKVTEAVAGMLVLGATTYLGSKGLVSSGSSPMRTVETVVQAKATAATHVFDFRALHHVANVAPEHHERVRQITETTLHHGDNTWTVAENQLHAHGVAHPSDLRTAIDDQRLMKLNHISKLQTLKLQVGDRLKLLKVW